MTIIMPTISLPEDLVERLNKMAEERRVPVETVIREAIGEEPKNAQPKPRNIGIFGSGRTDISELASDIRPEPRSWR